MRAVLDANILVSAALSPTGKCAELLRRADQYEPVVSDLILTEAAEALIRPSIVARYGVAADWLARFLAAAADACTTVNPSQAPRAVEADPDDDWVLACAVAARAEYIVTGDRHLLDLREYRDTRIVSPATFAEVLQEPDEGD